MSAAEYYMAAQGAPSKEERLNTQARDIAQGVLLFQAQLRGFLVRNRLSGHVWGSDSVKKHKFDDIHGFPNEIVYENRVTNTGQISNCVTEKDMKNIKSHSIYPHVVFQGSSVEIKSVHPRTQRPESEESLTDIISEFGNHYVG